jgi:PAS domain S-box-containing protein
MKMMTKLILLSLGISVAVTALVLVVGTTIISGIVYSSEQRVLQLELAGATQAIVQKLNRSGVRAAAQTARELSAELRQRDGLRTAYLYVVEMPDNRVVFHPEFEPGDKIPFDFIDEMFRRHEGSLEHVANGVARFAAFTTVHPLEWLVGLDITRDEMLRRKFDFLRALGGITFLILCFNALVVGAFGKRLVTRIGAALDCVKRIEKGVLSARIPGVAKSDEIGHLQQGINAMSARIEQRTLERQAAEQALRESQLRLAYALDAGRLGSWELDLATGTTICSLQHNRIFGYHTLVPDWGLAWFLRHVLPEDRGSVEGAVRLAIESRTDYQIECRIRRADGEVRWIETRGSPHGTTAEGRVAKFSGIIQDITERKEAWEHEQRARRLEGEIRVSEEKYRLLREKAHDAILLLDPRGVVLEANRKTETLFGRSRDDIVGRSLFLSVTDAAQAEALRKLLAGDQAGLIQLSLAGADDRPLDVEVSAARVSDEGQDFVLFIVRDVTQRVLLEQQLRQSQKMDAIGQLTGGIAHDFNNILTVITGTIEILIEGMEDRPSLAAIARLIDEAAVRGADLTQQLLAFARKQALQPCETDINVLVVETARLLRPTLGGQIEIEAIFDDNAWWAMIDPTQLSTALLNLAVNARDAMPNGGKLMLETANVMLDEAHARANPETRPGPYVMITVSDTGTGIPAAIRDKVFDPFFTTKEVGKGTGLGLSMVYGFVKQSGGHIKICSEEGQGTAIKLYLPRSGEPAGPPDTAPPLAPQGGNESILVVEDDTLVRNYVVAQLQSLGYATIAAANSCEALALVDQGTRFDLLFTDVIMPGGMNGRELAGEVAKRRPALRVLYTSGYTEDAIVHHGRLDPGVALLNKPYRKADLARRIREVLATAAGSA